MVRARKVPSYEISEADRVTMHLPFEHTSLFIVKMAVPYTVEYFQAEREIALEKVTKYTELVKTYDQILAELRLWENEIAKCSGCPTAGDVSRLMSIRAQMSNSSPARANTDRSIHELTRAYNINSLPTTIDLRAHVWFSANGEDCVVFERIRGVWRIVPKPGERTPLLIDDFSRPAAQSTGEFSRSWSESDDGSRLGQSTVYRVQQINGKQNNTDVMFYKANISEELAISNPRTVNRVSNTEMFIPLACDMNLSGYGI